MRRWTRWGRKVGAGGSSHDRGPSVLLVTDYYPVHGGGLEIVAGQLAKRLSAEARIEWFAAAPTGAQAATGPILRPMRSWNGLERRLGLPVPLASPRSILAVMRAARRSDVVWAHDLTYLANLAAALSAIAAQKPLVVTVHVGAIPYRNRAVRKIMAVTIGVTGRLILQRAAAVVFVSERVQGEFLSRWHLRRPRLIPNGVDLEVFKPLDRPDRERVRRELGLGDRQVVLFVGRFVERKGLVLLHSLARRMPEVEWLFAGHGPLDPGSWDLPNVHVERGRSGASLAELYGAADLLVLPSLGEGFPLVVSEALASGLTALVDPSTIAGCAEVAAVAFQEPVLGADAEGRWSRRIEAILRDEADRTGDAARRVEFARSHWNWDAAAAEYSRLFGEVRGHEATSAAADEVRPAV